MRKSYLDNIRWAVQIVVVLYHVVYMYNAVGIPGVVGPLGGASVQYADLFMYIVYPWLMPVLFLVSGIAAQKSLEQRSAREFLRQRTVRLLVPSTVGLFVFQFVQGYVNMTLGGAWTEMAAVPALVKFFVMCLSGIGVLWYLQLLWVFSLLLLPIRKLEGGRLHRLGGRTNWIAMLALVVPVWLAGLVGNTPLIVVYRFGLYGIIYLLGYFVFSHDEVIERLKKLFPVVLVLALGCCAAFCVLYFGQNYADYPINRTPLFAASAWFGSLAILSGAARFADFSNGFTRWMSKNSFGLYVFHYLGVSSVGLFLAKPGYIPAPLAYLLSLIAGFGGAWILNAVISRIPVVRWCVLGIGGKKKSNEKEGAHVSG